MSSSNLFSHSKDVEVTKSTIQAAGRDQHNTVNHNYYSAPHGSASGRDNPDHTSDVLKMLRERSALSAGYDSSDRDCCLESTRLGILQEIKNWVDQTDGSPICFLTGPAGWGKTTLAQTIAQECAKEKQLAASFFFRRGEAFRSNVSSFFFTVAYQFAISVPSTRALMQQAYTADPRIPDQNLQNQFQKLIFDSSCVLKQPMIVVVDALDEAGGRHEVAKLIDIIVTAYRDGSDPFPLRFFFTSRALEHIEVKFVKPKAIRFRLEDYCKHADIREFFRHHLLEIRDKNDFMKYISGEWPSTTDLDKLVHKSEYSFIWASTVLRIIDCDNPREKLQSILQLHTGIDYLYREIILSAPRKDPFQCIVGTILLIKSPLPISQLCLLLDLGISEVRRSLVGLKPILMIPERNDQDIKPFHASLRDFFTDADRSYDLFINPGIHHWSILLDSLRLVTTNLEKDETKGQAFIYASGNWCYHLRCVIACGGKKAILNSSSHTSLLHYVKKLAHQLYEAWVNVLEENYNGYTAQSNLTDALSGVATWWVILTKDIIHVLKSICHHLQKKFPVAVA